jgi:hypothetical protein
MLERYVWPPTVRLARGQTNSGTFYLHDFFTSIPPGRCRLTVTLAKTLKGGAGKQTVKLGYALDINIRKSTPEDLGKRIQTIAHEMFRLTPATVNAEGMRQMRKLYGLDHPELVPVLIEVLSDPGLGQAHLWARHRIRQLCTESGDWDAVVRYLAASGNSSDKGFFDCWRKHGVELTPGQQARLLYGRSSWARLYLAETSRDRGAYR